MEILDLKFAGIPIWLWLIGIALAMGIRKAVREWLEHREVVNKVEEHNKKLEAKYRWDPESEKWVRKDGKPGGPEYDIEL